MFSLTVQVAKVKIQFQKIVCCSARIGVTYWLFKLFKENKLQVGDLGVSECELHEAILAG